MDITIKDIEANLKTLPQEFLGEVNDYIDFLKKNGTHHEVPEWQKEEVRRRAAYAQNHPESFVSESEMDKFLKDLEREN